MDYGGVRTHCYAHWGDEGMNWPTSDTCHLHKQELTITQLLLVVFRYDKRSFAEFHLYQMDDFVGPFDDKVYLCSFLVVALPWHETP